MRTVLPAILLAAACGSGKPPVTTPAPTPTPTADDHNTPAPPPVDEPPPPPSKPVTNKTLAAIGLDPDAIDRSADPCDDFYQFACGNWIAKAEIPADKPETMRSFVAIDDRNLDYEHDLLERAKKSPGGDPILEKIGTFYGSCMDEAAIEKAGIKPIKPMLDVIGNVKDAKSLSRAIAVLRSQDFTMLFAMGQTQDSADATKVIAGIDQSGLGLPDRDYYLQDSDDMKKHRADYAAYVAQVLEIAGHKPGAAQAEAADIVALETQIAKVSKD